MEKYIEKLEKIKDYCKSTGITSCKKCPYFNACDIFDGPPRYWTYQEIEKQARALAEIDN